MKTLKSALLALAIMSSSSAFAIEAKSALTDDAKTIVNNVSLNLNLELSDLDKVRLFESFFKSYVQEGWNLKPVNGNAFLGSSKVVDHPVTFVSYSLSYDTRTVFMTLVNYSDKKQILATISEVMPFSTSKTIQYYNDKKSSEDWEAIYDTSSYSMFQKKGNISYANYHVNSDNATIVYTFGTSYNY